MGILEVKDERPVDSKTMGVIKGYTSMVLLAFALIMYATNANIIMAAAFAIVTIEIFVGGLEILRRRLADE